MCQGPATDNAGLGLQVREEDRAHHGVNDKAAACAAEVVTKPCLLYIFPHEKKVEVLKGSYKGAFLACNCFSLFLDPSHTLTAAVQRWIFLLHGSIPRSCSGQISACATGWDLGPLPLVKS